LETAAFAPVLHHRVGEQRHGVRAERLLALQESKGSMADEQVEDLPGWEDL